VSDPKADNHPQPYRQPATVNLKSEANDKDIFDFIENPIEPEGLEHSVYKAANAKMPTNRKTAIAILDVDENGSVLFANSTAQELLDDVISGRDAANLADIFSSNDAPDLDAAVDQWISVTPSSDEGIVLQLRAQKPRDGSRIVVMRRPGEPMLVSRCSWATATPITPYGPLKDGFSRSMMMSCSATHLSVNSNWLAPGVMP